MTTIRKAHILILTLISIFAISACSPAEGEPPDSAEATQEVVMPTDEPGLPPAAVLEAQSWLADQLGVPVEEVAIVDMEQAEWGDSCLGLGGPAESCLAAVTPGWVAFLEANGQQYEVRTDETGAAIRSPQIEPELPGPPDADNSLAGTQWQLVSFGPRGEESPVVADSAVTLQFENDGQAGGSGGCNNYGADYTVEGNTLSLGEVVSTLMACADAEVTDQEQRYFGALSTVGEFELSGDALTIFYDGGQGVLNFVTATASG